MSEMRLWVVEMWIEQTQQWEPTVGVGLVREAIRREIRSWRQNNPTDKFRIAQYVRK